jgi:hypothetical protein
MDEDLVRRLREAAAQAFEGEPVVFAYLAPTLRVAPIRTAMWT